VDLGFIYQRMENFKLLSLNALETFFYLGTFSPLKGKVAANVKKQPK
jgi:hypothetical protein